MTTLIALHGFTQNGGQLRAHLTPLLERLPTHVATESPDAPHACTEGGVARLQSLLGGASAPPPHLTWWDSTDDGRLYRGWEDSLEFLRDLARREGPVGLLGFSQGAMVAAALAGLAEQGEFPALRFVVLVAGRKPRADALQPLFHRPLSTPSLHVWGARDMLGQSESAKLVQNFAEAGRKVAQWPGPHVVPTHGSAADAIVDFIGEHAAASQ